MEKWRRVLGVLWIGLGAYVVLLAYATRAGIWAVSDWQYALYWFLAIGTATPILSELSMRRRVTPRFVATANDFYARGRHRFASIEARHAFPGRMKLEARYLSGPFLSVTIAPRSAANVSPATATDFWTFVFQVAQILTLAAYGRYLLVATAPLGREVRGFRLVAKRRRKSRSSRHPDLPPWLVARRGSDRGVVSRIGSQTELAGLGPQSRIRSVAIRGSRLIIVAGDTSERALEGLLTMVDIAHSALGQLERGPAPGGE